MADEIPEQANRRQSNPATNTSDAQMWDIGGWPGAGESLHSGKSIPFALFLLFQVSKQLRHPSAIFSIYAMNLIDG